MSKRETRTLNLPTSCAMTNGQNKIETRKRKTETLQFNVAIVGEVKGI